MARPSIGYTSREPFTISPFPRASAATNFGMSSGATPMSESRMRTTSAFAWAKAWRTASPFPRPGCLRRRNGRSGISAITWRMTASVSSVEPPSTKRHSLPSGSAGSRSTRGRMCPASLRQGITTLTVGFVGRSAAVPRGSRPGDDPEHEGEQVENGEPADVPVEEVGNEGEPQGGDDVGVVADHLEVRQGEHVLDLLGREPGLGRLAVLHPEQLAETQERLPEAAVAVDEDTRARVADRLQRLEGGLDVGEVRDHVDEEDHVERPVRPGEHPGIGDVSFEEAQRVASVALAGGADGRARDVDPHAPRRLQRREEMAGATAEVENTLSLGHPDPQDARQVVVVVAVPPAGGLEPVLVALVEAAHLVQDGVGHDGCVGQLVHRPGRR